MSKVCSALNSGVTPTALQACWLVTLDGKYLGREVKLATGDLVAVWVSCETDSSGGRGWEVV